MNVLETAISHLSSALAVPVSSNVPAQRPDAFVTVERAGGSVTKVDDHASLTMQVWDRDRLALEQLTEDTVMAMLRMPDAVDEVFSAEVQKSYYPEQVNGYFPRYVLAVEIYCGA